MNLEELGEKEARNRKHLQEQLEILRANKPALGCYNYTKLYEEYIKERNKILNQLKAGHEITLMLKARKREKSLRYKELKKQQKRIDASRPNKNITEFLGEDNEKKY